jgi:peptide/nickel transport system permease protein
MWSAIARRVGSSVVALAALLVFVFVMARFTGDPASMYLGEGASPKMLAAYRAQHGLDKPILAQFGDYLHGVVTLNFGQSTLYNSSAMNVALTRFPNTLVLALVTFLVGLLIGTALGSIAAYRSGTLVDKVITSFASLALSVPSFWLAIVLILVFALKLGWLPTTGKTGLLSFVMPLITLIIANVGVIIQVARDSMAGVLKSDYVVTAHAKGLGAFRIVFRHALRNAAIPVITIAGATAIGIVNGALIVETVFDWPGIGKVVVDAVLNRDFALLQAAVIVIGAVVLLLNLLIDLSYAFLDPRIRQQQSP